MSIADDIHKAFVEQVQADCLGLTTNTQSAYNQSSALNVEALQRCLAQFKDVPPPKKVYEIAEGHWKQCSFPKSKARRIRKKWARRRSNWRYVENADLE